MAVPAGTASERTIFVLGVTQRVGTHFLETLLAAHPDCVPLTPPRVNPRATFEDFLLDRADLLDEYVRETQRRWDPHGFGGDSVLGDQLRAALGTGLLEAFEALLPGGGRGKRLIARTPKIGHLDLLPTLFPGSQAVVIVRDPRAVAESSVRTFGAMGRSTRPAWEGWVERWSQGVRDLLRCSEGLSLLQVQSLRFEDLHQRRREMVDRLLDFLGLDADRYPYDELDALPVLGSSSSVTEVGRVHWDRAASPTAADVEQRGTGWPPEQLARLAHLAGPEMRAMGYPVDPPSASIGNRLADGVRSVERRLRRTVGRPWPG